MQIKYLHSGEVKHVKNEIGQEMVSVGLAVEISATAPKPVADVSFLAKRGQVIGDFEHAPHIAWSCATCGENGVLAGPTVHQTQPARCRCGATKVPGDVAADHVGLRKVYEAKKRRR